MTAGKVAAQAVIPMGSRDLQRTQSVLLGQFADKKFGFHGRLAHVVVLHSSITGEQLVYAYQVGPGFSPVPPLCVDGTLIVGKAPHFHERKGVCMPALPVTPPLRLCEGCCTVHVPRLQMSPILYYGIPCAVVKLMD